MRKLMLLVTMLAMVLSVTVPALAQSFSASSSGDNSNSCMPGDVFSNEGYIEDEFDLAFTDSEAEDIEISGSSMEFTPNLENECGQAVEQSSSNA